ncbi:MAG TPA: GAF domain-containing sensor histidine kinase [Candidatus Dormibacteraeota bacterium]
MDRRTLDLLAIDEDLDLDRVLDRVLRGARSAAGARYGALGVPDGHGGFARFLTAGVSERRAGQIGELPRVHGVLGALLDDGAIRLRDIRRHPRFGYYPAHHPVLTDFLGVPIRHRGDVLGNLYLSGSRAGAFTAADQRTVETLAAYAGVAIANATLYRRAQELATVEERARVARELHDSVSQRLFGMVYEARAAALQTGDAQARDALRRLERGVSAALEEMKALVYAVRPKSLDRDGLEATLRDHVEALRRTGGAAIELRVHGELRLTPSQDLALLRIAQEAIYNALRHAAGARVQVGLEQDAGEARLSVRDWGPGFDPAALPRARRTMGLATMRERATAVRATLELDSAPGRGTEVRVRLRVGRRPRG